MGSIQVLSKLVQNQIAAGEVVERPLSIIKELVENSLDAEATDIVVELRNGGKTYIRVTDNGHGMDEHDVTLSVKRHATSKIKEAHDLMHIHSFGFRGEALASIASVSEFTISSKQKSATCGHQLKAVGDEIIHSTSKSATTGTSVTVENLFFNVPARKKYLKTDQTEFGQIKRYLYEVALSQPEISLTLIHNDKKSLDVRQGTKNQRIMEILGTAFVENTIDIFMDRSDIQLRGKIAIPSHCNRSRKNQYIFINNRPVFSPVVAKAISESYHRITEPGMHPEFLLFIDMPPESIDVNVHPRKLEVKFAEPQHVFKLIKSAADNALRTNVLQPKIESTSFERTEVSPVSSPSTPSSFSFTPSSRAKSPYAKSTPQKFSTQNAMEFSKEFLSSPKELLVQEQNIPYKKTSSYTCLGQLHNCYILAQTTKGLVLIDQHAAHERVLFDKLVKEYESKTVTTQKLLAVELLTLSKPEISVLEDNKELIEHLGYDIEEIGDGSYALSGIPVVITESSQPPQQFLKELLSSITESDSIENRCKQLHSVTEKALAYTACRSATMFGDALSRAEQEQLLHDFDQCERKFTCPHGRTSIMELSLDELKKFFDR